MNFINYHYHKATMMTQSLALHDAVTAEEINCFTEFDSGVQKRGFCWVLSK